LGELGMERGCVRKYKNRGNRGVIMTKYHII
jgi:hypothetical protein